jgi:molecular chaperone Hsp33
MAELGMASDDLVMPFEVKPLGARGRVVRLGPVIDDILNRHDYPAVVSAVLAEAVALTAMLGATLKFHGKFILQTKTDGPVDMIVADFVSPGGIRGYARFNAVAVAALDRPTQAQLLGKGYLAMTVDQGQDMDRYQGIVPLDGGTLAEAADTYFRQSEQIPTRLRLAAGPLLARGAPKAKWRAGAILVQYLPQDGGHRPVDLPPGDAPEGIATEVAEDDDWTKAKLLLDTVEDHELLDPTLGTEDLLYRLYHEDGVTVYPAAQLVRHCTCSHATVETMLRGFPVQDQNDMIVDGEIKVTCEFCSTDYRFTPSGLAAAGATGPS